jgi:integrase
MLIPTSETTKMPHLPFLTKMTLAQAFRSYLERRKDRLSPRSLKAYRYYFRTLERFFKPDQMLSTLDAGQFHEYQRWRASDGAGPSLINHELGALAQVLKLADLWHPISQDYKRLHGKSWVPSRLMTAEDEQRFIRCARKNPDWKTALNAALVTGNTTLVGCEIRTLKLENLGLRQKPPVILIPVSTKNRNRRRGVRLNAVALAAMRELVGLAIDRGSYEPHHYLIPLRVKNRQFDPSRPASSCFIRTAFRSIGRACGLPWITPTTFRHQATVKLAGSEDPDQAFSAKTGRGTEETEHKVTNRVVLMPVRAQSSGSAERGKNLPLLGKVKAAARRLGISPEIAVELVLTYESSRHA